MECGHELPQWHQLANDVKFAQQPAIPTIANSHDCGELLPNIAADALRHPLS
jgi:hypothetical protein